MNATRSSLQKPFGRLLKDKAELRASEKPEDTIPVAELSVPPKRVLFITHNHPDFSAGGAEILAYRLFQALRQKPGWQAYFLAAAGEDQFPLAQDAPIAAMPGKENEWLIRGEDFDPVWHSHRKPALLAEHYGALLQRIQPDVVHVHHTLRIGMELLPLTRRLLPDTHILYTLHDFVTMCLRDGQMVSRADESLCTNASPARCHQCYPEFPAASFRLRELSLKHHLNSVDAFISPSHFLAARYLAWGLPAQKLHVIPNGTVTVALPTTAAAKAKALPRRRFAYFGQLTPYKGIELLLDAAEQLVKSGVGDFTLTVHGGMKNQHPDFQEKMRARFAACPSQIRYQGAYGQTELPQLMAQTDWVVVPSTWWENAPLVIDEAFLHGKPIICSDIGGMAEKVSSERTGLHFTAGNAAALATTMRRACESPDLWENLKAQITPPMSVEACLSAYIALYNTPEVLTLTVAA